jgi:hypothetical protein
MQATIDLIEATLRPPGMLPADDRREIEDVREELKHVIEQSADVNVADLFKEIFRKEDFAGAFKLITQYRLPTENLRKLCAAVAFALNDESEEVCELWQIEFGDDEGGKIPPSMKPPWMRNYCPRTYRP